MKFYWGRISKLLFDVINMNFLLYSKNQEFVLYAGDADILDMCMYPLCHFFPLSRFELFCLSCLPVCLAL